MVSFYLSQELTMTITHAALLGIIQGFTEVLPISSSAHLILIPRLLGWSESGLTFDVALHLGTFIALSIYFRRDIVDLVVNFSSGLRQRRFNTPATRLPLYLIAGTIPAAIFGKTLEKPIEELFRQSPLLIAGFLMLFGLLLALADTIGPKKWKMDRITLKSSLLIGIAQCLALVPGVSRSGITITAALFLGFNRESAARFSFLLSLPIVAGAALLKVGHLVKSGIPPGEGGILLTGIATSAICGYLSVALLLKMVQRYSLYPFVWYRLVAGAGFFGWFLMVR